MMLLARAPPVPTDMRGLCPRAPGRREALLSNADAPSLLHLLPTSAALDFIINHTKQSRGQPSQGEVQGDLRIGV